LNSQVNKSTAKVRKTGIICYDRSHLLYYWTGVSIIETHQPSVLTDRKFGRIIQKWPNKIVSTRVLLNVSEEPEGAKLILFYSFFSLEKQQEIHFTVFFKLKFSQESVILKTQHCKKLT
jgi:hypothetical protein